MGMDGMVWWIGTVANNLDPLKLGRAQVRIYGWHTEDANKLPRDDLPWATQIKPCGTADPVAPPPGRTVMGFFLDGQNGQFPVIFGEMNGIPSETIPTTSPEEQGVAIEFGDDTTITFGDARTLEERKNSPRPPDSFGSGGANTNYDKPAPRYPEKINEPNTSRIYRQYQVSETLFGNTQRFLKGPIATGIAISGHDSCGAVLQQAASLQRLSLASVGTSITNPLSGIAGSIGGILNSITGTISAIAAIPSAIIGSVVGGVAGAIGGIASTVVGAVSTIMSIPGVIARTVISQATQYVMNAVMSEISSIGGKLADMMGLSTGMGGIAKFAKGLISGVQAFSCATAALSAAIQADATNAINQAVNSALGNLGLTGLDASQTGLFGSGLLGGSGIVWNQPASSYASANTPYIQSWQTESGNLLYLNSDTPKAEMMARMHRSGTYEEFHTDGSMTLKVMKNTYTLIAGTEHKNVDGTAYSTINGNQNTLVMKDRIDQINGSVGEMIVGSKTTTVGGGLVENIIGSRTTAVMGSVEETVMGSKSETVIGFSDETITGMQTKTVMGIRETLTMGPVIDISAIGHFIKAPLVNLFGLTKLNQSGPPVDLIPFQAGG